MCFFTMDIKKLFKRLYNTNIKQHLRNTNTKQVLIKLHARTRLRISANSGTACIYAI